MPRYTEGISGRAITPCPCPHTDASPMMLMMMMIIIVTITGRENGKTKTIAHAATAVHRILTPLTDGERDSYAAARAIFSFRERALAAVN